MSENTYYQSVAVAGPADKALAGALNRRGIFFHDTAAWETARKRSETLQEKFELELREKQKSVLDNPSMQEIVKAESMLASFNKISVFRETASQIRPLECDNILQDINRLRSVFEEGRCDSVFSEQANALQKRVADLASNVQETLCRAEEEAILQTTSFSLSSLGYIVEQKGSAIKATRGHICLWAKTTPWSELSLDFSGYSGRQCLDEKRRVEKELGKNGLILGNPKNQFHGKPEGGAVALSLAPLFPVFKGLKNRGTQTVNKITGRFGI
jgi:hypothetical protein